MLQSSRPSNMTASKAHVRYLDVAHYEVLVCKRHAMLWNQNNQFHGRPHANLADMHVHMTQSGALSIPVGKQHGEGQTPQVLHCTIWSRPAKQCGIRIHVASNATDTFNHAASAAHSIAAADMLLDSKCSMSFVKVFNKSTT